MSDLIRREDALRVTLAYASSYSAEQAETAIRALPAVQPDADELVGHMTKLIAAGLDRVEQLTAERDQWIAHTKNAVWADSEELKLAEAERDRLREALEGLMAHEPDYSDTLWQDARAALKGESHE